MTAVRIKVNHRKETAKVRLRGTDPAHGSRGLRFRCKLDRQKRFTSCRSPKLYRHLTRGKHTLRVKAVDKAGNASRPIRRRFRI